MSLQYKRNLCYGCVLPSDEGQNLLCKSYDDTARQGEKTVRPLGRVMGLEGEAHLDNTPAQQDQAHRPDQAEDELRQIVDHLQGVISGEGRHGTAAQQGYGHYQRAVTAEALFHLTGHGEPLRFLFVVPHFLVPPVQ